MQAATNDLISQERLRELMLWIAPDDIDPDDSYKSALGLRQSATGRWFLMSTQFRAFLGDPAVYSGFMAMVSLSHYGSMIADS